MSRRKLTGKPGYQQKPDTKATSAAVATIPLRLEVVFALDGQPLGAVGNDIDVPVPAAGSDDRGHIVMQLDAREIVQRLTHALAEREAQKRGGLLLPGANRPIPAGLFKGPGPSRQD